MKKNLKLKSNIFLYELPFYSKNFDKKFPSLNFCSYNNLKNQKQKNVRVFFSKLNKKLDKKLLKKFSNLEYIISPTTGIDHIDQIYCKKNKIKIINLEKKDFKNKNITSTIEHSITLILASVRSLYSNINDVKHSKWDRYCHEFLQFKKYTVGIIGNGRVGSGVAKILKYLNFNVLTYDKNNNKSDLNKIFKRSNIISFHINSDKNKNFFNKKSMILCKKDIKIINTARGEIINEKDLMSFLIKNDKASAFIDVISNEQIEKNNFQKGVLKFNKNQKNLFITPHVSGAAIDAQKLTEEIVLLKYMKNEYKKSS